MWYASRCAVFGPTPGSFESSSIRRASGRARAVGTSHPRKLQAAGEAAELVGRELFRLRERVGGRDAHEVLEGVDVFGIDSLLLDADLFALLRPGHDDDDRAPAGGSLDRHSPELLLGLRHVGLHLLRELLNVAEILHSISMMRSGRPSVSMAARSIGSSVAASGTPAWRTHFTRIVAFRISERSCSSSARRFSCQSKRANSSPKPMTMVAPSIASGSAFASCAALPMLRSFARSTSSPHALRTVSSFTTGDAAPTVIVVSVTTRRLAMATIDPRGASRLDSERVGDGGVGLVAGRSASRRASGGGATFSLEVTRSRIASSSGRGVPSLVRRCCSVSIRRFAIFAS